MARYIDADLLIKNIVQIEDLRTLSTKTIGEAINKTPTADVAKVVRCKDCKFWSKQKSSSQGYCYLGLGYPTGGWFCGNGRMQVLRR